MTTASMAVRAMKNFILVLSNELSRGPEKVQILVVLYLLQVDERLFRGQNRRGA